MIAIWAGNYGEFFDRLAAHGKQITKSAATTLGG
jgi:hypothetical protein